MNDIGTRLTELRKSAGLSQRKLATLSGVSQAGLSFIESNEKSPNIETLSLICKALNVTLSDFLGTSEPKREEMPHELQQLLFESSQLPVDKIKILISSAKAMQ